MHLSYRLAAEVDSFRSHSLVAFYLKGCTNHNGHNLNTDNGKIVQSVFNRLISILDRIGVRCVNIVSSSVLFFASVQINSRCKVTFEGICRVNRTIELWVVVLVILMVVTAFLQMAHMEGLPPGVLVLPRGMKGT